MSKKSIEFREADHKIYGYDFVFLKELQARCSKRFRYWETVTLMGHERIDIADANRWIPCNTGFNNIVMAWRIYWENDEDYDGRTCESEIKDIHLLQ